MASVKHNVVSPGESQGSLIRETVVDSYKLQSPGVATTYTTYQVPREVAQSGDVNSNKFCRHEPLGFRFYW